MPVSTTLTFHYLGNFYQQGIQITSLFLLTIVIDHSLSHMTAVSCLHLIASSQDETLLVASLSYSLNCYASNQG